MERCEGDTADQGKEASKRAPPDRPGKIEPHNFWPEFGPPRLPEGLLPERIETFARGAALSIGADIGGLAMAALAVAAAAIHDNIQLQVMPFTNWKEFSAALGCRNRRPIDQENTDHQRRLRPAEAGRQSTLGPIQPPQRGLGRAFKSRTLADAGACHRTPDHRRYDNRGGPGSFQNDGARPTRPLRRDERLVRRDGPLRPREPQRL